MFTPGSNARVALSCVALPVVSYALHCMCYVVLMHDRMHVSSSLCVRLTSVVRKTLVTAVFHLVFNVLVLPAPSPAFPFPLAAPSPDVSCPTLLRPSALLGCSFLSSSTTTDSISQCIGCPAVINMASLPPPFLLLRFVVWCIYAACAPWPIPACLPISHISIPAP